MRFAWICGKDESQLVTSHDRMDIHVRRMAMQRRHGGQCCAAGIFRLNAAASML